MSKQVITPWEVTSDSEIDYDKLIDQFGCKRIDDELIERWERVTGAEAHLLMKRGIYFSHQDLDKILDCKEKGEPVYIYTGRGPSSESSHLGHILPFMFTKYLQDALDAFVVIQMSDDEKFLFRGGKSIDEYCRLGRENAKDIIACGFNPDKTYIFSNFEKFGGDLYRTELRIANVVTGNQIRGTYGIDLDATIGKLSWATKQCAPAFAQSFPFLPNGARCLVPMGIDQAPYFRTARRLKIKGFKRPATIHSKFLPALEGKNGKMGCAGGGATLFLTYSEKKIRKTINKHAFSGGRDTLEEHRELGGRIDVDIAYQYLLFFEPDDEKVKNIAVEYSSGRMLSSELKRITGDVVWGVISRHQKLRAEVTDDIVNKFFDKN